MLIVSGDEQNPVYVLNFDFTSRKLRISVCSHCLLLEGEIQLQTHMLIDFVMHRLFRAPLLSLQRQ